MGGTVSLVIGYLTGRALDDSLVLVGGVGYAVATAHPLPVGTDVDLWIHTAVRENDISLFGFTSRAERDLFECLTKVTGVGPKVALGILSLGPAVVVTALRDRDPRTLAKAPGIGVKKAETIISAVTVPPALLDAFAASADPVAPLVDALAGLGFDAARSRRVVDDILKTGVTDESVVMRRAMNVLRAA